MLNYAIPIIEQLASGEIPFNDDKTKMQIQKRRELAKMVSDYLQGTGNKWDYFYALSRLLDTEEYQRLLFYLPLEDLQEAPEMFRFAFLRAWHNLLHVYDARENFFEGDTFEVDARPNGELELVVKCAHLTPWLIEAGYLDFSTLKGILKINQDDEILMRSFANTWQMVRDKKLLSDAEMRVLERRTAHVTQRERLKPLYVSEKRRKWLSERGRKTQPDELLTPNAKLAGPFSPNMSAFMEELESLQTSLKPDEIVLVGGSRLRGYGLKTSDFDVFSLQGLSNNSAMIAGSPHSTHVYFNTLWLGGSEVKDLNGIAMRHAQAYFGKSDRIVAIERLESDLLLYRLLHTGFVRFYGGHNSIAKSYQEMDGDCPFYDEQYRKLATELFVKYVFIPTST